MRASADFRGSLYLFPYWVANSIVYKFSWDSSLSSGRRVSLALINLSYDLHTKIINHQNVFETKEI